LCLILVDIDRFKRINDRYGHAVGDEVLRRVGRMLREAVRGTDLCARLGGEEFGILMRVARKEDAPALAAKLCRRLAAARFSAEVDGAARDFRVTASFGVATGAGVDVDALYREADTALYRAKASGRNCVVWDGRTAA
jgi:diguanylate cyclase (GGDEF)-like protein